jgi:hypothetical protein
MVLIQRFHYLFWLRYSEFGIIYCCLVITTNKARTQVGTKFRKQITSDFLFENYSAHLQIHITASTINIKNVLNIHSISHFYKEIYHGTRDEIAASVSQSFYFNLTILTISTILTTIWRESAASLGYPGMLFLLSHAHTYDQNEH